MGFSTLVSSFSLSFNSRRRIFPLKDLGISSMNSTPPRNFLYGATFSSTKISTSLSVNVASALRTTNAIGSSPASILGSPITAASSMSGWEIRRASSSAGGTWNTRNVKIKSVLHISVFDLCFCRDIYFSSAKYTIKMLWNRGFSSLSKQVNAEILLSVSV